jgi:hypothetical protein
MFAPVTEMSRNAHWVTSIPFEVINAQSQESNWRAALRLSSCIAFHLRPVAECLTEILSINFRHH